MNILVFDLDYTLTNHNGKVPRSTYHMLKQFKRNKFIMTIITYNPVPQLTPNFTDLYKYFETIHYGNMERSILFKQSIKFVSEKYKIDTNTCNIYYIDDRQDNIDEVINSHSTETNKIITYYCEDPEKLYRLKELFKFN